MIDKQLCRAIVTFRSPTEQKKIRGLILGKRRTFLKFTRITVSLEMASSSNLEDCYHRLEVLEKVWTGFLWHNLRRRHGTAKEYFRNFATNHPGFQFTIVSIHDGSRHPMVSTKQYEMMKKELEHKTGTTLPTIDRPFEIKDPSNGIVERRVYGSQAQLNAHFRELVNESEKIYQKNLRDAAQHKNKLRQTLSSKKDTKFLSFDVEVYDRDWKTMLEIGYVKFTLQEGNIPEYFHAVVNDDLNNREGFDNKEKFKFGRTVRMTLGQAAAHLQNAVREADALVAHSGGNDESYLAENGISLENKPMFDTQVLALDLLPRGVKSWGLKKILEKMGIRFDESILHNAGNDAHYTMLAFKALAKRAMPGTLF